ncbi:MAG: NADP-dependent isocitrate dehydrogenase, partial [Ghiorsea sp.]
ESQELQSKFVPLAKQLAEQELVIVEELNKAQGKAVDMGGYYHTDTAKLEKAMRPSATFNRLLASL